MKYSIPEKELTKSEAVSDLLFGKKKQVDQFNQFSEVGG
jgi:hypothetical protein